MSFKVPVKTFVLELYHHQPHQLLLRKLLSSTAWVAIHSSKTQLSHLLNHDLKIHKNNTVTQSVSRTTNLFESPMLNLQLTSTIFTQSSQKLSCKFQQITRNQNEKNNHRKKFVTRNIHFFINGRINYQSHRFL